MRAPRVLAGLLAAWALSCHGIALAVQAAPAALWFSQGHPNAQAWQAAGILDGATADGLDPAIMMPRACTARWARPRTGRH